MKRPQSSIDQNILSSARSNYQNNRFMRNLRSVSQCQQRDESQTYRGSSQLEGDFNTQNKIFEQSWMKAKLQMESLNSNKLDEEQKLTKNKIQTSQNTFYNQKTEGLNQRRFSYQLDDLSQFDDKDVKENFEHSSLYQMYQLKKKELFQRANNITLLDNLKNFQNKQENKQSSQIEVSLKHKIQQFQSLFGHSPQKNQILLKQKNTFQQNFESNHKKKYLSLSVDESQNNDFDLSLQPLQSIQLNGINSIKLNGNSINTSQNFQNHNSNKSKQIHSKNPVYCTIYKEKLQNTNNVRYFRNIKLDLKAQPQLSFSILNKIHK